MSFHLFGLCRQEFYYNILKSELRDWPLLCSIIVSFTSSVIHCKDLFFSYLHDVFIDVLTRYHHDVNILNESLRNLTCGGHILLCFLQNKNGSLDKLSRMKWNQIKSNLKKNNKFFFNKQFWIYTAIFEFQIHVLWI